MHWSWSTDSDPRCFLTWEPRTREPSLCRRLLWWSKYWWSSNNYSYWRSIHFVCNADFSALITVMVCCCANSKHLNQYKKPDCQDSSVYKNLWCDVFCVSQNHSREVGSSQQVSHEPQGWKLLLQKPSSKTGRAAGQQFHSRHQVVL